MTNKYSANKDIYLWKLNFVDSMHIASIEFIFISVK